VAALHRRIGHRRIVGSRADVHCRNRAGEVRGRLVGFFQFNIVFGILAAYLSNYLIGTMGFGDAEWRWKLGISAVPGGAVPGAALLHSPESPRWLAKQGRVPEAEEVLRSTGDPNYEED
jgi:MFS transporter, SP family, arabinose:H+ symporter